MPIDDIEKAVRLLKKGRLVAFPTETVYGLGADARSQKALTRLFTVKGRPTDHPVIVHLGSPDWISRWAEQDPRARALAQEFWPGPLTMILKRKPEVLDAVTGGQPSVGLRMPSHPLALQLLNAFGDGLAAPSANRFGKVSPTTAAHVLSDLGTDVDFVLDGGACQVGLESTIVDLSGEVARVLRPGHITESEIEKVLGRLEQGETGTRAPGMLKSHYAPATPTELLTPERVVERLGELEGESVAVWSRREPNGAAFWLEAEADPRDYAQSLYANLRRLDLGGYQRILVEEPPEGEPWLASRDRLRRATA
ncbi:MAG: threonylcarbamoyl-AMP synthase [Myxococcales bacterium]|nr:threonylcarbamoyl-AMP synthase [Myxococcales bacterium]MCA9776047.1 threonylcarbamoyl-AMP synthase [Candidatus Eremiobacteraeota bacterium]